MCDGFDEKAARADSDLMILGKVERSRDLKATRRIETDFKVLKTLKGDAKSGSVTVVAIDNHVCTDSRSVGSTYVIALKQIEGGKYYYDCCDLAGAQSY